MTDAVDNPPPSRWTAVVLFLLFFLPFLPAIPWTEFAGGMENFNVGTAQEIARNGNWLVPTLNGEIRTKKPPLASWISAAGIRMTGSLPWGARLPNVLCTGLLVVAIYYFGREIGGNRLGLISALVGGSSFLVLQFAVPAQYDMPFAVCITLTNLYLAKLALRGRWFEGCIGAGFWLGMACMVKGPAALLMTLVPFVGFALVRWPKTASESSQTYGPPVCNERDPRRHSERTREESGLEVQSQMFRGYAQHDNILVYEEPRSMEQSPIVPIQTRLLAILAGVGVFLLVAAPWPIYIFCSVGSRLQEWQNQLTQRQERVTEEHTWWWKYVLVIPWFAPWALWYAVGLLALCLEKFRPLRRRMLLMVLMVWLPVIVLSFYPARRPRYILPLAAPLAVLAAWRIEQHFTRPDAWKTADRLLVIGHGGIMTVLAIGLPVAGMFFVRTFDGRPWYGLPLGFGCLVAMVIPLIWMWRRMTDWRVHVGGSAAIMLMLAVLFLWGYKDTPGARSPSKDMAIRLVRSHPGAEYYSLGRKGLESPTELTIYLNSEVRRCANLAKLPKSQRPQIVFMGTPATEGAPDRPGWRIVDKQYVGKTWWYAMIRE